MDCPSGKSRDRGPEWLGNFLRGDYFSDCHEHVHTNAKGRPEQSTKKGDRNFFCSTCSKGPLCDTSRQMEHSGHRVLQVRKASHMDAIRIHDIVPYIDITGIQPYTINAAKIVFLPSRPQSKPSKGSPYHCLECERTLQDDVTFCSIECKFLPGLSSLIASGKILVGHPVRALGESSEADEHLIPATVTKKRARSSSKMEDSSPADRPMIKNLKTHREHAPGVTGMGEHLKMPTSPISVLHNEDHSLHMPENSGAASACPDSSSPSHDNVEITSFRKRSRKGIPYRAPGVGIIRPEFVPMCY